jgi:hypothetical protein
MNLQMLLSETYIKCSSGSGTSERRKQLVQKSFLIVHAGFFVHCQCFDASRSRVEILIFTNLLIIPPPLAAAAASCLRTNELMIVL